MTDSTKGQTVIFDLGQVICPFDLMIPCGKLSRMNGMSPEDIKQRIFFGEVERDFETGRITGEAFAARCNELLGLTLPLEVFRDLWCDMFHLNEAALQLVDDVRESSQVLMLSNTCAWHIAHVERLFHLRRHFDDWVLSFEVGAMKPDERIYRAALEKVRLPDRCVFIDDLQVNVDAAGGLGIPGIRFSSVEQTRAELIERGFLAAKR